MKGRDERTDTAALSAGMLGVFAILFVREGPFDVLDPAISITLLLLVWAYIWNDSRGRRRSAAIASVVGLTSLPLIGFLLELRHSADPMRRVLFPPVSWDENVLGPYMSYVPYWELFLAWLGMAILAFGVDRVYQRKTRASST